MNSNIVRIRRALISVSDKNGLVDFSRSLADLGVELVSTGGTARQLGDAGISTREVGELTGFPEMMDGRVKTLHPVIHGGILGRRGLDDATMDEHNINPIDLVVVNLYPFQQVSARPDCDLPTAIENIDIGGPTMLRAAAKNHRDVVVVVNSSDYSVILDQIRNQGGVDQRTRFELAVKVFEHTARYDGAIANYLGATDMSGERLPFAQTINLQFRKAQTLRYGENPHQKAAFYTEDSPVPGSISDAKQLQGKELSYNNIADTDAALECVKQFSVPTCVIVKHANPCGVASSDEVLDAYNRAYSTDPESAFGGIIAFNTSISDKVAAEICNRQFVEVIIAPHFEVEALTMLASKKNVRVLQCGSFPKTQIAHQDYKRVNGGLLVQDSDSDLHASIDVVSNRDPADVELEDLLFGWRVAKYVKSNAIVYVKDQMTVGVGAGQMSRVNSARIAAIKAEHAGLEVAGSVMASDAFFPFRDAIDTAAKAGISSIIQPGGSMRDDEVIQACNEHDIAMVFTGMRHFRH